MICSCHSVRTAEPRKAWHRAKLGIMAVLRQRLPQVLVVQWYHLQQLLLVCFRRPSSLNRLSMRFASKHSATIRNLINPTRDESLTANVVTALSPDEIFVTAYPVYDDIVTSGEKSGLEVAMPNDLESHNRKG